MTPSKILADLCAKHRLPLAMGQKMLPLIERGLKAPDDKRTRILTLASKTIRRAADRYRATLRERDLDKRMLGVVAKVVHPWSPPNWTEGDPEGR